jgi:hypothetical protein
MLAVRCLKQNFVESNGLLEEFERYRGQLLCCPSKRDGPQDSSYTYYDEV